MLLEDNYRKVLVKILNIAVVCLLLFLFFKYLFGVLLPFIVALLVTMMTRPLVNRVSKKTGMPKKLTASLLTLVIISILFAVVYISVSRLISELISLVSFVSGKEFSNILNEVGDKIVSIVSELSGNKRTEAQVELFAQKIKSLDYIITEAVKEVLPTVASKIGSFLSGFPSAALFCVVLFVSLFYVGFDYEKICTFLRAQVPQKVLCNVKETKKVFLTTLSELFKAYFLITFITFLQLVAGFLVLKVRYAVLLALVVAVVDMLPVLGTGTVLVPWAVVCFVLGDVPRCIGLLVIYAIITLVRQIAEPKIVGSAVGLSPLVTLISMYAGIKLMGFAGLFVFPVVTIVIKSLNDKKIIKIYNSDFESNQKSKELKVKTFENYKKTK